MDKEISVVLYREGSHPDPNNDAKADSEEAKQKQCCSLSLCCYPQSIREETLEYVLVKDISYAGDLDVPEPAK